MPNYKEPLLVVQSVSTLKNKVIIKDHIIAFEPTSDEHKIAYKVPTARTTIYLAHSKTFVTDSPESIWIQMGGKPLDKAKN
jgi:hypothetical protein